MSIFEYGLVSPVSYLYKKASGCFGCKIFWAERVLRLIYKMYFFQALRSEINTGFQALDFEIDSLKIQTGKE